jgi:hypothetical protein
VLLYNSPKDGCRKHVDSHGRVEGDAPSFSGDLAMVGTSSVGEGDGV